MVSRLILSAVSYLYLETLDDVCKQGENGS